MIKRGWLSDGVGALSFKFIGPLRESVALANSGISISIMNQCCLGKSGLLLVVDLLSLHVHASTSFSCSRNPLLFGEEG